MDKSLQQICSPSEPQQGTKKLTLEELTQVPPIFYKLSGEGRGSNK